MKVLKLLDEFEEIINEGSRIPMTGKVMINEKEAIEFIDRIRSLLPEELTEARWVAKERQRVLADAQREAERMLGETKEYITKLVNDNEIIKQAQSQGDEIVERARGVAREIRAGANRYAHELLERMEGLMEEALQDIRKGKTEINKG